MVVRIRGGENRHGHFPVRFGIFTFGIGLLLAGGGAARAFIRGTGQREMGV